jgi:hypothetical protein
VHAVHTLTITDEASPLALRSTRNRLRRAMRQGAAWTIERHQVAAWSLSWLRSVGGLAIAEPTLVAKPQTPALQEGARRVPWAALWSWRRGCPKAFRAVRPFPVRVASDSPWRAGWGGRCPARYDRTGGVRKARPIVASIVDAGHDRTDIGGGPGLRTFRHRAQVQASRWTVPILVAAGLPKGASALPSCPVRSGQGQDVQAAWLAVASWPEAWSVGRWALEVSAAWPPPSGPGPDPSAGRSQ